MIDVLLRLVGFVVLAYAIYLAFSLLAYVVRRVRAHRSEQPTDPKGDH